MPHRNCKGMYRFASLRGPIGKEPVFSSPVTIWSQIGFDPERQTPDDQQGPLAMTESQDPAIFAEQARTAGPEPPYALSFQWYVQSNGRQHARRHAEADVKPRN
jgi:hypothetical protein